jgi:acyl dehydratase
MFDGAQFFEDYVIGAMWQTHGRTIGETDIIVHAGHSGDFFPHHMDAEWAAKQQFGQRIAHGTMTFTIGVGLTATKINPAAFTYGFDRLRFPKPVHIGDTIHTRVTILSTADDAKRPEYGRVVEKCEVINQHGVVVMACDHVLLAQRRNKKEKTT